MALNAEEQKELEEARKLIFGEDGDALEEFIENFTEEAEPAILEAAQALIERVQAAVKVIDDLKYVLEDYQLQNKEHIWKCQNIMCGHVFEADHDKCPKCYGL